MAGGGGGVDGRTDWQSTLFDGEWTYAHLLRIEAPNGTLLHGAGSIGTSGGSAAAGQRACATCRRRPAWLGRRA